MLCYSLQQTFSLLIFYLCNIWREKKKAVAKCQLFPPHCECQAYLSYSGSQSSCDDPEKSLTPSPRFKRKTRLKRPCIPHAPPPCWLRSIKRVFASWGSEYMTRLPDSQQASHLPPPRRIALERDTLTLAATHTFGCASRREGLCANGNDVGVRVCRSQWIQRGHLQAAEETKRWIFIIICAVDLRGGDLYTFISHR